MIQCSSELGYFSLIGLSTMTTSPSAASTSSTLANCEATQRGNSKAATFVAPSTGSGAYCAYPGKLRPATARPASLPQSK